MSNKLNLSLVQGKTFTKTLRWETDVKVYKPISSITNAAPCTITCTSHGIPEGWRFKVTNVVGMTDINVTDYNYIAKVVDVNTIEINKLNSIGFKTYTSGGIVEYNAPQNLTGYTARMQIREAIDSTTVIKELTTENNGITVDSSNNIITLVISATETAAFTFTKAVYDLEMVHSGVVTTLVSGAVTLAKEVTR